MIKLIFSFILIISASLTGNAFSQKIINRRKTLSSIVSAISRIKTLICFGGIEVTRVVEECLCSEEFPLMNAQYLSSDKPYEELFELCVDKIDNNFSLTKSDKMLLNQFGTKLGATDVTGQIAHTELYAELFTERLNVAKEQEFQKAKLYKVLGFSVGCALSLLII